MNPAEWYSIFLTRRKLSASSGDPLYSYKIAEAEYVTLTDTLKLHTHWARDWDCCFVLYATEWWRRCYEGGYWSWDPILRSINKATLPPADRNLLAASGFKKWRRPVTESLRGNDFIGTIVLECGLPFKVLESEHYLADVITDLYEELGAISSIQSEHLGLVRSIPSVKRLPQTLQKDAFFYLLLQFVKGLVDVNEKYGISASDNPAERLDSLSKDWRDQFPLRIDGGADKGFIDRLLTGVTKTQKYQPTIVRMRHQLVWRKDEWRLKTMLNIKGGIYQLSAIGIPDDAFEELSNKLEIHIETSSGDQRIGYAFKKSQPDGLMLDAVNDYPMSGGGLGDREPYLLDPKSFRKIPMKTAGVDLDEAAEPLIFAAPTDLSDQDIEGGWELVTAGSAQLKHGQYRVLCTEEAVLLAGEWKPLGQLVLEDKAYAIYEVSSEIELQQRGNTFQLEFSAETEAYSYEPAPSVNGFEFCKEENKAIYRGWPKIYKVRADGAVAGLVGSGLEYLKGKQWTRWSPEVAGKVKIRLTNGSRVLFCKTLRVLPAGLLVEFNAAERKVLLVHSSAFTVTIYSEAKTEIALTADGHSIYFPGTEWGGADLFELGLTPKGGETDSVILKVPYPSAQLHFSSSDGRLGYRARLYLHELIGSRLYINNLSSLPKIYRLKLSLLESGPPEELSVYRTLKVAAYGSFGLPLVNLRESILLLLSMTASIDVRVLVSCNDKAAVEIGFFEFSFDRLGDGCMRMHDPSEEMPMGVSAFRLDRPFDAETPPALLHRQEDGCWCLPDPEGVWFIYPAAEVKAQFRPLSYSLEKFGYGPMELAETLAMTRMQEAAVLLKNRRAVVMNRILDAMAVDASHPDWIELRELANAVRHLPLSSLDHFTLLCDHNDAILAAAAVLPEELVLRLSQEFAVIWARYPVDSWMAVFRHYHAYLVSTVPRYAEEVIRNRLAWIGRHLELTSIASVLTDNLYPTQGMADAHRINEQLAAYMIGNYLNGGEQGPGLRGRHDEDEKWPELPADILGPGFKALPAVVRKFITMHLSNYQRSVVYLPFILAAASVQPESVKLPGLTPLVHFKIRETIAFDEQWFADVYNFVQGFLLANT